MSTSIEFLTPGRGGRRRYRRRSDEEKALVVAQTPEAGAGVREVVARQGLRADHLSAWRRLARGGKLAPPAPESPMEFAALTVARSWPAASARVLKADPGAVEILVGSIAVRLDANAPPERIAAVAAGAGRGMIFPMSRVRVLVAAKPVDFRKGHDGLAALVKNELRKDPAAGTVFVFRSRRADRLKLLYWDGNGLVMAYKRLEAQGFAWPPARGGLMTLSHARLKALFAGLDWRRVRAAVTKAPEVV
jgi:transposase